MRNDKAKDKAFRAASNSRATNVNDIFKADPTDGDADDTELMWLSVHDIIVGPQIREEFEDEDNTLKDLAENIKKTKGVLQAILVRPAQFGRYELIAGERRLRATMLAGKLTIPALVKQMTDEEAEDAQLAENIHRKNLTQIEEAKKIQKDLDALDGNVDAVLKKHHKSRSWLSKILGLLELKDQAKRLVTENISADLEVINQIKIIEKIDPEEAKKVVDKLSAHRGKLEARKVVAEVKEKVKPSGKTVLLQPNNVTPMTAATPVAAPISAPLQASVIAPSPLSAKVIATPGLEMATATSKAARLPGEVVSVAPKFTQKALSPGARLLENCFVRLVELKDSPTDVFASLTPNDIAAIKSFLEPHHLRGLQATNMQEAMPVLLSGMRIGDFSGDGATAFAFIAYFQGLEKLKAVDLRAAMKLVQV